MRQRGARVPTYGGGMSILDDIWSWISTPLQELTGHHRDHPELGWDELKAHFVERAGLRDASDHPVTDDLCRRLDDMSHDDRAQLLDDDGKLASFAYDIAGQHAQQYQQDAPAVEQPAPQQEPDQRWYTFIAENGPRWDGTQQSWQQFKDWFRYQANEQGLLSQADGFLGEAEQSDKHAVFARYGVTVARPAAQAAPAEPDQLLAQLDQDVVTPLLTQLLQDSPELAGMGEDQLRAMIGAALAQEISARAGAAPQGSR